MIRREKIVIGIIVCAFSVLILMFAAVLVTPWLVDSKTVRDRLRSEVKKATGVDVDFKHLRLDLFPRPYAMVDQVEMSMPPRLKAAAVSLTIHPRILPLFFGKMQLARLRLDSAELNYTLPIKPIKINTARQPVSIYDLGKKIQSFVSVLPEFKIPDLDFQVVDSRVNLFDSERKILTLSTVNTHIAGPPAGRTITLDCQSSLWQHISMSGLLNTRTYAGSGQIQLTKLRPKDLAAYLFPDAVIQVVDAPADLTIDFKTGSPGQLQAELNGSSPRLNLRHAGQALSIKNTRIKATVHIDQDATTLSLTELAVDDPRLNLSGNLVVAQTTPQLSLQVEGSRIDVAATRRLALALSGENHVVKSIFDIVRGGNVPSVTLKTQGDALKDLGNADNLVIRGQMQDGDIRIPDIPLDLKETSGEIVISRGVIEGKNLQTRLGKSTGQNGRLKLGFVKDAVPFYLETDIRADLSQLPPILKRLIHDKDFHKQLALIKDMKGSANGKLVIKGERGGVKVKVDASDIHITAGYAKMPHPVEFKAENFTYDDRRIGVKQLNGRMGKSSFSGISGYMNLDKQRQLKIESGRSEIVLADIFPRFSSMEADTPLKIRSFSLTGNAHDIAIESADLAWLDMQVKMTGNLKPRSRGRMRLDLDIAADTVDLAHLNRTLKKSSGIKGQKTTSKTSPLPVQGAIRFKTDRFKIDRFTSPLHADINLDADTIDVRVKETGICGITLSGTAKVSSGIFAFNLDVSARDQALKTTLDCFAIESLKADGTYRLNGKFTGSGKIGELLGISTGHVELEVPDGGHIYHDVILLNVLKLFNTLEMLTDKVNVKDMGSKGFGYHSFRAKAKLQGGKLRYEEAVLHGQPMTITAAGEQDIQSGKIDMDLLVAPLVTLDRIFAHIPLIGGSLNTLDAIPLSLRGTLENIHIYPLAPSALGYQLKETMEKTVERRINLMDVSKGSGKK